MAARISTHEIVTELRRELAMRERVYPGLIAKGTLTSVKAERQMALLKAAIGRLDETMSFEEVRQLSLPRG